MNISALKSFLVILFLFFTANLPAQKNNTILPAAYNTQDYLPLLAHKKVAVFANHTSTIHNTHIIDLLINNNISVQKIFAPEHGFRGKQEAGETVHSYIDSITGISVISLYGKKKKPTPNELADIDVLLFDIQDVGVRFYTYISSLELIMEAAFESNKTLVILDRPNPLGFYVDGPVLDTVYKSFVGMQPIPVVYGMTIAEYALMLAEEQWLSSTIANRHYQANKKLLQIVACKNYTHNSRYQLPIAPSPNLPHWQSVYWYPSTCFFEGTVISEGRGTENPFCYIGHPSLPKNLFAFVPTANKGAKEPKYKNDTCYGFNLMNKYPQQSFPKKLQLQYLLKVYQLYPNKNNFFIKPANSNARDYFFNKLAGNEILKKQIELGFTEKAIRASWQPALKKFKTIRKKYLLYPDFE
jgi:uncharacterized protein YbbC (DUF1343 family)